MAQTQLPYLVRRAHLKRLVGVSPTWVDAAEARGEWPQRVRLGGIVGWLGAEIVEHIESEINRARATGLGKK
jgi:predicted DNA-binding transcriptional regulator AlpA